MCVSTKKWFFVTSIIGILFALGFSLAISSKSNLNSLIQDNPVAELIHTDDAQVVDEPMRESVETELQIEYLRKKSYQTDRLEIVETLSPGSNYQRYYATYQSEGLKQYGLLTIPNGEPAEGGWPAIIFNHGYISPSVYKTTERYVAYVDYLARNGYVVFRPDYRGHDQSEGEAQGGYGNSDYLVDVLHAYDAVSEMSEVNPDKIGMWGHSMGGWITHRAMVINPNIKVGVIWAGVVGGYDDLLELWRRNVSSSPQPSPINAQRRWRTYLVETFGSPESNREFWNSISATNYLADMSGPVQIHHGTADNSVPVTLAERYAEKLAAADQEHELYIYPGDDHNLSASFSTAMRRTVEYFDRYLK